MPTPVEIIDATLPQDTEVRVHSQILSDESTDLAGPLFGPMGGLAGGKLGVIIGTFISPGVGTVIGAIVGALAGALSAGYLGRKILPPITRFIAQYFDDYQKGNALAVKRAALVGSSVGTVIGGLLGNFLIPVPGLGLFLGAIVGSAVFGTLGFSIARLSDHFFQAKPQTLHMTAYGAYIGAVLGCIAGSFLIPIPFFGTLIGATAGAALGAGITTLSTWVYNSFRSEKKSSKRL